MTLALMKELSSVTLALSAFALGPCALLAVVIAFRTNTRFHATRTDFLEPEVLLSTLLTYIRVAGVAFLTVLERTWLHAPFCRGNQLEAGFTLGAAPVGLTAYGCGALGTAVLRAGNARMLGPHELLNRFSGL